MRQVIRGSNGERAANPCPAAEVPTAPAKAAELTLTPPVCAKAPGCAEKPSACVTQAGQQVAGGAAMDLNGNNNYMGIITQNGASPNPPVVAFAPAEKNLTNRQPTQRFAASEAAVAQGLTRSVPPPATGYSDRRSAAGNVVLGVQSYSYSPPASAPAGVAGSYSGAGVSPYASQFKNNTAGGAIDPYARGYSLNRGQLMVNAASPQAPPAPSSEAHSAERARVDCFRRLRPGRELGRFSRRARGTLRLAGHESPRRRRQAARRRPEVAHATGIHRHALEQRHRLPQGLSRRRDPVGQEDTRRGGHRHGHTDHPEPQGRFLEVRAEADAQTSRPGLCCRQRGHLDHHEGRRG